MFERCSRSLVKGFLKTQGTKIINGDGEEIILTGWGLGNWLLPEGYMWQSEDNPNFDRPRRIEKVIENLAGGEYAKHFWTQYRKVYINKTDIRRMAELGYNSVRIPIHWRVLMRECKGSHFVESGFRLLDQCINWCEEYGLYVILDLHGAPGGQTGANIDDSIDDQPRLFIDQVSWNQAIDLWKALAQRYKDRWIVGGYDLLNEPLRPGVEGDNVINPYLEDLVRFYEECIQEIRKIDARHLLFIEGHRWSTSLDIFYQKYDDHAVLHFHRYACMPEKKVYDEFIQQSQQLQMPLWLGETGENTAEWFAAMYPLSVSLGIGYNLWPWKKMECENSPASINMPDGWGEIISYTVGGKKPSLQRVQEILDTFLQNVRLENCTANDLITRAVFRQPPFAIRGTDFEEFPGNGESFSSIHKKGNPYYRSNTGMDIVQLEGADLRPKFTFDSGWDRLSLQMRANEFASYFIDGRSDMFRALLSIVVKETAEIEIVWQGMSNTICCPATQQETQHAIQCASGAGRLVIRVISGLILLNQIDVEIR